MRQTTFEVFYMEDYWKLFVETGSIDAYLAYKKSKEEEKETEDQNEFQC